MKIKYIAMLSVLAVAFAAASLWVFATGGNNAKAVKTKFRLGGLMLTVSGMLSVASCEDIQGGLVTCYDPVPPEYVIFAAPDNSNVIKAGDTIDVTIKDSPYSSHIYKMFASSTNDVLQSGEIENNSCKIVVGPTEYKGDVTLIVYGVEGEMEFGLGSIWFSLE